MACLCCRSFSSVAVWRQLEGVEAEVGNWDAVRGTMVERLRERERERGRLNRDAK